MRRCVNVTPRFCPAGSGLCVVCGRRVHPCNKAKVVLQLHSNPALLPSRGVGGSQTLRSPSGTATKELAPLRVPAADATACLGAQQGLPFALPIKT